MGDAMTVAYDAGPLIAADRNDREMWAYHRRLLEHGRRPVTTAPVVAQVSRPSSQVTLHRLLAACRIIGFDADDVRSVGALLARSNTSDVVDAHLVCVAERIDALVLTSDGDDIAHLADHAETSVRHRRL
ncbi:MAG: PIN domain-containing protein [Ilumatobacter sp.]|uniref:PIN domain-containing protein n=2 Tax=Ilumatobacter sp. TaxID=1967498 RepID=UPI0032993BA9